MCHLFIFSLSFSCFVNFVMLLFSTSSQRCCMLLSLQPQSVSQPYGGGGSGLVEPPLFFPTIPERPVSFSPPPSCPPKAFNVQRRKSTSILEAHTRHFQPAYHRCYGSSLHPFSGMEALGPGVEPSLFMMPSMAPQRLAEPLHLQPPVESLCGYKDVRAEQEETVRRLSLNQAALMDHLEAMAYSGYPMTAHQLSHISFHQQMQVAAAASWPMRLNHSLGQLTYTLMSRATCAWPTAPSRNCLPWVCLALPLHHSKPQLQIQGISPTRFPIPHHPCWLIYLSRAPPLNSTCTTSRRTQPCWRPDSTEPAGAPWTLTWRNRLATRALCGRLQPVTEELYSYVSPELPLPPGSLLLHGHKELSPEPSSDSLTSSDAGEFHSPPPHQLYQLQDCSAAQSVPQTSYYKNRRRE